MSNSQNMTGPPSSGNSAIGGSNLRTDSLGKVTGHTRYAEDISLPGMLHACVLRSPLHHCRLISLDVAPALLLPGVVRILTSVDISAENGLTGYSRDEPLLTPVGDTLRQQGAPIALVIADSLEHAKQGAGAIQAEYEKLPHTFDADEALKPDSTRIYPDGNVLNTYSLAHGDLQAAFDTSAIVLENLYQTGFQEHSAMEREAAVGYIDESQRVTVIAATHEPHWQQEYIAQTLGLDVRQVRVIVPPTGGSFGGRQDPWPLVAAGLMAHVMQCPVCLAYSRQEVFNATPKRHAYSLRFKVGATQTGRLTGIQVRIDANTGGYDSAGYWIPNYAVTASGGAYSWQAVDAFAQSIYTNAAKCGQFRGFGTPQSVFALECMLDELAQSLDIDPLDLRMKNILAQDGVSFLGYPVAESLGYTQVLETLRPHYQALLVEAEAYNTLHAGSRLRMATGLAGMWYRFGKSGSLRVETHAELAQDGHFIVYCSAPDYGQGTNTIMVQLAAEAFGIARQHIELVNADTALTPDSGIQGASRATYFIGNSVIDAAENLKHQVFSIASEMLDCDPRTLQLEETKVVDRRDPNISVSLQAIASEFERIGKSRKVTGIFDLSPQFPEATRPEYIPLIVTGAQLAQVLVDLDTGQVDVQRIIAAHDVGRAINPPEAHGQIRGAVVMGVGSALFEEYIPGASTGFTNYILPMIHAVPDVEVILVEVPSVHGPHGAKGLGEAAILPTAPAIINAVSRAIGRRVRRIPATPPRLLEIIQSAQHGAA